MAPGRLERLSIVRVGRAVKRQLLSELKGRIAEVFAHSIPRPVIVDYQAPALAEVDAIEASLLTGALAEEVGGHVLGVTDVDLHDSDPTDDSTFLFGGKDNRNDVAVVSTRRLGSRDPDLALARVLKVALHELGHNFGLAHHYTDQAADGGGLCLMTRGDFNRFGERAYVRAVIDQRGLGFCGTCRQLIAAHG